jgi:hypothetical protein
MQADNLRQLNQSGQAEAVVAAFEQGRVAFAQETLGEYIRVSKRLEELSSGSARPQMLGMQHAVHAS